ncbi:MAG: PQQ-binding-like beta-propeller repeat protein [Verrucomicrobiales bacterium]|nr:PQQ-binding-like beta-propeller repeat protein [Verrucomicrobiales bacterium]
MKTTFLAATTALIAWHQSAVAEPSDWPQYRGRHLDGSTTEKISKSWPSSGLRAVWKTPLNSGFSSFTTGGGKAYTLVTKSVEGVNRETLVALDADSGKEAWSYPLEVSKYDGGGDSGTSDNKGGDGPRSTPSYVDGKVYAISLKLKLVCLDASSGKLVWARSLTEQHGGSNIRWQNAASPVVDGDLVFLAGGGAGQALLGLNRLTGDVVWKGQDDLMTHATPVVTEIAGDRQVIFFTQSGLVSVVPSTGKVLWRHKFPFSVSTAASPVVSGDIVYCSAGYGVGSSAVRVKKAGDTWSATELWRLTGNKICNHWSTPVLYGKHLYGMFSFKEYGSGPMKCVEIETGKEVWAQAGFGPGNLILVDGALLALSDAGDLVLVKPDPSGYSELARTKAVEGKCWSTPVVSHGKILVRSTKEGAAFSVGASLSRKD